MARKTNEELEKVKQKYNVDTLYSWSRIESFRISPYQYFLHYILNKEEDRQDSIYGALGGQVHDVLERLYTNQIEYSQMVELFNDSWLTCYDLAKLHFDRNDLDKDKKIAEKYKIDLEHFFEHHKKIERNVVVEKFLTSKIGDYVLQGYCDALYKNDDNKYVVVDWKTSSYFSQKATEEKCGQLVCYCLALMQAGIDLNDILACWNMLKYCTITYQQANGKVKTKDVERCKLGESLQSNLKVWLKRLGYEEQMDEYLKLVIDTNSIECLPEDVRAMYEIDDCWVYVNLTQKLIDKWTNEIITTIKDIELRQQDYEESHNEKIWWDNEESVKAQSYYFATLSGYSGKLHKPYGEYLEKLEAAKNGGDLFGGLGTDIGIKTETNKNIKEENPLAWLDEI